MGRNGNKRGVTARIVWGQNANSIMVIVGFLFLCLTEQQACLIW
jgi:hypothetical protein